MNFVSKSVGDKINIGKDIELCIVSILDNGDVQFEVSAPEHILAAIKNNDKNCIEKHIDKAFYSLILSGT